MEIKWKNNNKKAKQINSRIQMLQQQQNRHNRYDPSGHHIRFIERQQLHNTNCKQQHHQYHRERHHGQTGPTSNNDDNKQR